MTSSLKITSDPRSCCGIKMDPTSRGCATIFHLCMAVYTALLLRKVRSAAIKNASVYDPHGEIPEYGGQFKYLTHINLWAELLYFSLHFLSDLLPQNSQFNTYSQTHLSFVFTTIVFPLACYVSLSFWAVYAYDKNLIYAEVSPLLNHLTHTAVVAWVLLEVALSCHQFPTLSIATVPISACCFLYIGWVELIHAHTGFWVYPIFNTLPQSLLYFVGFYSFSILICHGLFLTGKAISNFFH